MSVRRTIGLAALVGASLVAVAIGCKRSSSDSTADAGKPLAAAPPVVTAVTAPEGGVVAQVSRGIYEGPLDAGPDADPPVGPAASQVFDNTHTETVQGPGSAPPPTPVDPFVAPTDAVRRSAVGCFAGQPAGSYSATLTIYVTEGGVVSRVEVSPGNVTDDGVLSCLKQAGEGGTFPQSPGGRTLTVDVSVRG